MQAYRFACDVDVQAFKPGNVSVYSEGHGMTVADFRLSAHVSSKPLTSSQYSLGEKIYYAVKETRNAVGCNTNLGIILLCAPILHAVIKNTARKPLRQALAEVLMTTTVTDAEWVFKAIALASPGGLGVVDDQDVHAPPRVTLSQAMAMAADRDRIALQYENNYKDIFNFSIIRYNRNIVQWRDHNWAAVAVYAAFLCQFPDSHIERKYGTRYTRMVSARMAVLDRELSKTKRPEQLEDMLYEIDSEFKSLGVNPGTTADLTVATVLVAYLEKRGSE